MSAEELYQAGWDAFVMQDYGKALEYYQQAADAGSIDALGTIGYMYVMGEGVEQDYAKALEYYQKAADQGNASALYNLGVMYQDGEGVEQDYAKALEYYQKAADLGDTWAINNIGFLRGIHRRCGLSQLLRSSSR